MSDSKAVFRYPTPFSSLLTATRFFLLGLFHSLLAAFLGRHPVALASLTSWGPQVNFSFTASCSNVWDPRMTFCASPKSWCHFSSSAHCSTLSSGWSTPLPLLYWWSFHDTGIFNILGSSTATMLHQSLLQAFFTVTSLNSFAWPLQCWAVNYY